MTTQEIIDYYAGLLILQYIKKEKAYATIQTLVEPVIMDQLPVDVQDAFNLNTAEGVQLDVIGKYAGITRYVYDFTGPVTLDDTDFRQLIRIKIVQNNQFSSTYDIQNLLFIFFMGTVRFFDFQDMSVEYYFDAAFGTSQLAEIFIKQKLLPKPMGVGLRATIYVPTGSLLFSFRDYVRPAPDTTCGFSDYTSGFVPDGLWLSTANTLLP